MHGLYPGRAQTYLNRPVCFKDRAAIKTRSAYCFILNVISVSVGVSQVFPSLLAQRMLPASSPPSTRTRRLEGSTKDAQRIESLEPCYRVQLSYPDGRAQRRHVKLEQSFPCFYARGHSADMELKKSISDTERALKSYGAVSETAWTTDKGERHAWRHYVLLSVCQW